VEIIRTEWHGTRFAKKNIAVISADSHNYVETYARPDCRKCAVFLQCWNACDSLISCGME